MKGLTVIFQLAILSIEIPVTIGSFLQQDASQMIFDARRSARSGRIADRPKDSSTIKRPVDNTDTNDDVKDIINGSRSCELLSKNIKSIRKI